MRISTSNPSGNGSPAGPSPKWTSEPQPDVVQLAGVPHLSVRALAMELRVPEQTLVDDLQHEARRRQLPMPPLLRLGQLRYLNLHALLRFLYLLGDPHTPLTDQPLVQAEFQLAKTLSLQELLRRGRKSRRRRKLRRSRGVTTIYPLDLPAAPPVLVGDKNSHSVLKYDPRSHNQRRSPRRSPRTPPSEP